MARLGMRAGEVRQLKLEDIDWIEGVIRVGLGKSRRERTLPLLEDIGTLLSAYLQQERPASAEQSIFLTSLPPYRPLAWSTAISRISKSIFKEAGLEGPRLGAHRLRHSVATHLVRCGSSFKEIADLLGHKSMRSTGIYAKLDQRGLEQVALSMARRCAMNPGDLLLHLEAYLALENALGFSLRARERLLRDFVAFVEVHNTTGTISSQIALAWACSVSARCGVSGRAARLSIARRFLFHLSAMVPGIEVPSASLLARPQRSKPFLFSTEEISRLLNAALSVGAQASLQPRTLSTLLGLLVSSGLRANEALNLEVSDVLLDLDPPQLEIRKTKFNKSRLVPIHETVAFRHGFAVNRLRAWYHVGLIKSVSPSRAMPR
jgi:integrase